MIIPFVMDVEIIHKEIAKSMWVFHIANLMIWKINIKKSSKVTLIILTY